MTARIYAISVILGLTLYVLACRLMAAPDHTLAIPLTGDAGEEIRGHLTYQKARQWADTLSRRILPQAQQRDYEVIHNSGSGDSLIWTVSGRHYGADGICNFAAMQIRARTRRLLQVTISQEEVASTNGLQPLVRSQALAAAQRYRYLCGVGDRSIWTVASCSRGPSLYCFVLMRGRRYVEINLDAFTGQLVLLRENELLL